MVRLGRLAWAAMVLALAAPASAAPSKADKAHAAALKKKADKLVHASKFKEALKLYDESFALVPNPAIHYNRGRALERIGDYPAALDALDEFVATAPESLKRRVPHLDKIVANVASHVATLVVECPVEGATVTVRGQTEGKTPMKPFRTSPGEVSVGVTAPGYVAFSQDTTLTGGQTTTLQVDLKKVAAEQPVATTKPEPTPFDQPAPPPPPAATEHPASQPHGSGLRVLAWTSGAIGLASLAGGMIFLGLSVGDKNAADPHCPNKVCDATGRASIDEAWTFADISTVLVVVGAVGLATSLTSFLVTPKSAPVQARLFVGPAAAGIGGSF
jgi:hypothetical protein